MVYNLCSSSNSFFIFVPTLVKISNRVSALLSRHNSLKIIAGGDMVLVLCTLSDHACICTRF